MIQSKSADYAVGDTVVGMFGWSTHAIADTSGPQVELLQMRKVDPTLHDSLSTALGILGMPG